jgi:hypothetical protein
VTTIVLAAACLAVLLAGCGDGGSALETAGLDSEYVSVELSESYVVLMLGDDGSFVLMQDETDRYREPGMRRQPEPLALGEWSFAEGRLDLEGDGWTVTFESDSTRVAIPARSDTISSLRWVTSTEGSPFSACDLVSATEFRDFLRPPEGSGSEGM